MAKRNLDYCFGCGQDNPVGLRVTHSIIGDRSHIEFEVKPEHCGYPGLMHGGVTCVLMDEVMFHIVDALGIEVVIQNLSVDYKSPARVGSRLTCEAWIEGRQGRKLSVVGRITDSETGTVIAEAKGRQVQVDLDKVLGS